MEHGMTTRLRNGDSRSHHFHGAGADQDESFTPCLPRAVRSAHTLTGNPTTALITTAAGEIIDISSPAT